MCNEEEKDMAIAESRVNKNQSEAFTSIRNKIQSHMKKRGITYKNVLESISRDKHGE